VESKAATHLIWLDALAELVRQFPANGLVKQGDEVGHGELVLVVDGLQTAGDGIQHGSSPRQRVELVFQSVQVLDQCERLLQTVGQLEERV